MLLAGILARGGGGGGVGPQQRLNMEVDLQSLFGLHVTWCAQLYSLAEIPPPPNLYSYYEGAIGQQR